MLTQSYQSLQCPRCGKTTVNLSDILTGYCPSCRAVVVSVTKNVRPRIYFVRVGSSNPLFVYYWRAGLGGIPRRLAVVRSNSIIASGIPAMGFKEIYSPSPQNRNFGAEGRESAVFRAKHFAVVEAFG